MNLTDEFKPVAGIYIFKCLPNGKIYVGETLNVQRRIGEHQNCKDQIIHRAIKKYGIENFEVYVEYFPNFSKKDLLDLEEQLIIKFDCLKPKGYNICPRGQDRTGFKHSEESKRKMSEAGKGKKKSDLTKAKMSKASSSRRYPHRKRAVGIKKKPLTPEHKANISKGNIGLKRTEETRSNIGKSLRGKTRSEEIKKKMSEAGKARCVRQKLEGKSLALSGESKRKISLANKGRK